MSWQAVARKDFEDVIRSWLLWSIVGVFLVLMGIIVVASSAQGQTDGDATGLYNFFNALGAQLLVPVTALVVGYMAITAERQSGSLRILFGLSHGRRDVVLGKILSRSGAMVVAVGVLCLSILGLIVLLADSFSAATFAAFAGLTVLLALAFVGIAVGISAATASRARAMAAAIGSYVFFALLWHPLVAAIHYGVEGEFAGYEAPEWYFALLRLNPLQAYADALGLLTDTYMPLLLNWTGLVEDIEMERLQDGTLLLTDRLGGEVPVYLSEWASVAVLLVWFVVPVAIGYWRFKRADLN